MTDKGKLGLSTLTHYENYFLSLARASTLILMTENSTEILLVAVTSCYLMIKLLSFFKIFIKCISY